MLVSEHSSDFVDAHLLDQLLVVSIPHRDSTLLHLLLSSHQYVVPLGQLCISHLFVDATLGLIQFALVAQLVKVEVDGLAVVVGLFRDGADDDLSRREPEGPLSSQVLAEDRSETFD